MDRRWFVRVVVGFLIVQSIVSLSQSLALIEGLQHLALASIPALILALDILYHRDSGFSKGRLAFYLVVLPASAALLLVLVFRVSVPSLSHLEWLALLAPVLSGVLVVIGILNIWRSRLRAYLFFQSALLVSIFLTQVFAFYQHQFVAVIGLSIDILLLTTLRYMISQERARTSVDAALGTPLAAGHQPS